jgi:hypothetical protein
MVVFLVTGLSCIKAVSKQELGGRKFFITADDVAPMSGEKEGGDTVSKVEWPLERKVVELLLFCRLLVARGASTWKQGCGSPLI